MSSAFPTVLLAVDVGNSAIKLGRFPWPCTEPIPEPTDVLRLRTQAPDSTALHAWLPQEAAYCVLASVQRQATEQLLNSLLPSRLAAATHVLSLADFPLRVAVHHPERVGQDRLAAAVAAAQTKLPERAAVIVDAGSAITVDGLSPDNVFLGGAILPGLQTSATALGTTADLLPELDASDWKETPPLLGRSTDQAIQSGVFWGTVGAIRELVARTKSVLEREHGTGCDVILTGGDVNPLVGHLALDAIVRPHLVLTGIALVARDVLLPSTNR